MQRSTLSLTLLAAAALSACGTADLTLAGAGSAEPRHAAAAAAPNCVQFNVPPIGALFGAPIPNPPGSVVWVEQSIPVSVNKFLLVGGGSAYNWLRIEPAPAVFTFAAGATGHTNNINAEFDFTGLPYAATSVKFVFLHLGGYENLSINGSPIFVGPLTAPPAVIAGIGVASAWVAVPGGQQGTITLTGSAANPIKRLVVGGQELWLDTVCAFP